MASRKLFAIWIKIDTAGADTPAVNQIGNVDVEDKTGVAKGLEPVDVILVVWNGRVSTGTEYFADCGPDDRMGKRGRKGKARFKR